MDQELEKIIRDMSPLIERLHTEYNKFFTGAEKKLPIQMREQLDKMAERAKVLQRQCQNSGLNFRTQNILSRYNTYRALWDKKLKDREKQKS